MQDYPNTHTLIQFLATSLARFMAVTNLNGQKWSKRLVADYITTSEEIYGQISDTTLGRFLDPAHPQKPTQATVNSIAQFLLQQKAITTQQIHMVHKSSAYWKASVFADAFEKPATDTYQKFLQNLSGRYSAVNASSKTLYLSEVIIEYIEEAKTLIVSEIMSLYHVDDIEVIKQKTGNFDPLYIPVIDQLLLKLNARTEASFASTGYVTATTDIIAFFHQASGRGFSSIFNIGSLIFSKDENVGGFKGNRNTGWEPEQVGQIKIPKSKNALQSPIDLTKSMSGELSYLKIFFENIQTIKSKDDIDSYKEITKEKDFYSTAPETMNNKKDFSKTTGDEPPPNIRLITAFQNHDLTSFQAALKDGADPNLAPPGSPDPLIFPLARDGEIDWVYSIIKTGRCDHSLTDSDGFPASHAPAVMARQLSETGQSQGAYKRFEQIAKLLQSLEIEQLKSSGQPPLPN